MKKIPDKTIDIVLSDIPYGINFSEWDVFHANTNSAFLKHHQSMNGTSFSKRGKPINGWNEDDKKQSLEYQSWCEKWMTELFRITKEASPILLFSSRRNLHRVGVALENCGFLIRDILIWEKDRCNSKAQRINHVLQKRGIFDEKYANYRIGNLAPMYEPIIWAMKPYTKTLTDCVLKDNIGGFVGKDDKIPSNIFKCKTSAKNVNHPTEKPVELLKSLINTFSISNDHVVLDPFIGSGSTAIACIETNKNCIGFELDKNYFDLANERMKHIAERKNTYELGRH